MALPFTALLVEIFATARVRGSSRDGQRLARSSSLRFDLSKTQVIRQERLSPILALIWKPCDSIQLFRSLNFRGSPTMRTERSVSPSPSALTPSHTELSELLRALQAVRDGDFSVRLPGDWTGLEGKIADTFNEIVA